MGDIKIKFRVWDEIECKFLHSEDHNGLDFTYVKNPSSIEDYNLSLSKLISHSGEEVVIQQFTTLKDKNEKEIYDGDILEINEPYVDDKYVKVEMKYGAWGFLCHSNELKEFHWLSGCNKIKVVGNIFETPELLNNYVKK